MGMELNSRKIGLCHSFACLALRSVHSSSFFALVCIHRKISNSLAEFRSFSEMGGIGRKTGRQRRGRSQGISALRSLSLGASLSAGTSPSALF